MQILVTNDSTLRIYIMFPIPPSEHLIETKFCKHCGSSFPITDKDIEFYEKVSPSF